MGPSHGHTWQQGYQWGLQVSHWGHISQTNQASQWPSVLDGVSPSLIYRTTISFSIASSPCTYTHYLCRTCQYPFPPSFSIFYVTWACQIDGEPFGTMLLSLVNASGSEIEWHRLNLTSPAFSEEKRWAKMCIEVVSVCAYMVLCR